MNAFLRNTSGTFTALLLTVWIVAPSVVEAQGTSVKSDITNVVPLITETTCVVIKVDVPRLSLPDLTEATETLSPEAKALSKSMIGQLDQGLAQVKQLVGDQPVYATIGIPKYERQNPAFLFVRDANKLTSNPLMEILKNDRQSRLVLNNGYAILVPEEGVSPEDVLAVGNSVAPADMETAFNAVSNYPVQVLLLPPDFLKRTLQEIPFELPEQLGGGPSSLLSDGVQWAALGVDPAQLKTEFVVQSATEEAARRIADRIPKMLGALVATAEREDEEIPQQLIQAVAGLIKPQVAGSRMTIQLDGMAKNAANLKMLAAIAQNFEDKTRRRQNRDKFKQIMLGMHNYHDANKSFPPIDKYRGEDGKHHLSWRVHILPYVGEGELYAKFRLEEPWDSPHNKPLIKEMPDIYKSDWFDVPPKSMIKPGHTTFLAPVGEGTAFGQDKAPKFRNFLDGTSNTVVLVEVKPDKAVPWTAPQDYQYDPKTPTAGLLIGSDGKWLSAFGDGSANQLRGDISAEILLRLFQIADGNVIDFDQLR